MYIIFIPSPSFHFERREKSYTIGLSTMLIARIRFLPLVEMTRGTGGKTKSPVAFATGLSQII